MGDLTDSQMTPSSAGAATPTSSNPRPMPVREDCWSEEATATLVDAWGRRYLELNRGNLRQKDWQEVADAVNSLHGHTKKTHRTDVQCKNRIDTIKKKYKVEKARVSSSNGALVSSWRFFDRLDMLIGSQPAKKAPSPSPPLAVPLPLAYRKTTTTPPAPSPPPVPTAVALPQKRSASAAALDGGFFRMNYSAVAAAAAAEDDDEDEDEDEADEDEEEEAGDEGLELERGREGGGEIGAAGGGEGMKRLARAIERFGEVYHRVEAEKLRQMVDLEKQRLQFANELEMERMRIFMDTQVQLQRIKHGKRSSPSNDIYS